MRARSSISRRSPLDAPRLYNAAKAGVLALTYLSPWKRTRRRALQRDRAWQILTRAWKPIGRRSAATRWRGNVHSRGGQPEEVAASPFPRFRRRIHITGEAITASGWLHA